MCRHSATSRELQRVRRRPAPRTPCDAVMSRASGYSPAAIGFMSPVRPCAVDPTVQIRPGPEGASSMPLREDIAHPSRDASTLETAYPQQHQASLLLSARLTVQSVGRRSLEAPKNLRSLRYTAAVLIPSATDTPNDGASVTALRQSASRPALTDSSEKCCVTNWREKCPRSGKLVRDSIRFRMFSVRPASLGLPRPRP